MSENNSIQLLSNLENEFHVWFCFPDEITNEAILDGYRSILSAEEIAKYKRFHFEKDKHSYLVSHALVRKVLSSYCEIQPDEWRFTSNQHGKPDIASDLNCPQIKFNLSHTDGMSVCVVSLVNDCGVDVENIQRKSKTRGVAERMFAPVEVAMMLSCSDSEMQSKFFDYWTLRESYVKALGTGLGGSSKAFYFTVAEPETDNRRVANIHYVPDDGVQSLAWQFTLLNLSTEHITAVALKDESIKDKILVSYKFTP